jgi:hypothetical protein
MVIIHEDQEKEIDLRRHTGVKIDQDNLVMKIVRRHLLENRLLT